MTKDHGRTILREIIEGLEGVTDGTWRLCHHLRSPEHDASCSCGYRGGIWSGDEEYLVVEMGSSPDVDSGGQVQGHTIPQADRQTQLKDAAHIVRCSPDAMRAIAEYVAAVEKERDNARNDEWLAAISAVQFMSANWWQDCRSDVERNALQSVTEDVISALRSVGPTEYLDVKWKGAEAARAAEEKAERLQRELAGARRQAFAEAATLIEEGFDRGIKSKRDTCAHGKFQWEDCDQCSALAIRSRAEG